MEPTQENNQPNQEKIINDVPQPSAQEQSVVAAPKALDLLKAGWEFAKSRRDLFVWYIVSLSVMAALTSEALMDMQGITELVLVIAVFVTMIFVALNTWSIIYTVSQPDLEQITYEKAYSWAGANFFPLLWTSILSGIVVIVGFMLLIIPGIIFSVYLYFALYAQAGGVKGGKPALTQSWNDVKGRWWEVAKKLIGIGLYLLLVYIGLAIIYGVFIALTGESMIGTLIADVAMQGVAGGIIGVVTIHAVGHYYKYLKSAPLAQPTSESVTG